MTIKDLINYRISLKDYRHQNNFPWFEFEFSSRFEKRKYYLQYLIYSGEINSRVFAKNKYMVDKILKKTE